MWLPWVLTLLENKPGPLGTLSEDFLIQKEAKSNYTNIKKTLSIIRQDFSFLLFVCVFWIQGLSGHAG